jgi:hypothetical protein
MDAEPFQGEMLTFDVQARGKWMIPAYKVLLFTSFGSSMYMMGRLVLVSIGHLCSSHSC